MRNEHSSAGRPEIERRLIFQLTGREQQKPVEVVPTVPAVPEVSDESVAEKPEQQQANREKKAEKVAEKANRAAIDAVQKAFEVAIKVPNADPDKVLENLQKAPANKDLEIRLSQDKQSVLVTLKSPTKTTTEQSPEKAPPSPIDRILDNVPGNERNAARAQLEKLQQDGGPVAARLMEYIAENPDRLPAVLSFAPKFSQIEQGIGVQQLLLFMNMESAGQMNQLEAAKEDQSAQQYVKFSEGLSQQEREVLNLYRTIVVESAAAMPPEQQTENGKGIPEERRMAIKAAAEQELAGIDPSTMNESEVQMAIAGVMLKHGVSVINEGSTFTVEPPKTGWDSFINKAVGIFTYLGAIMAKVEQAVARAKGKVEETFIGTREEAPAQTPEQTQKAESTARVDKALEGDKNPETLRDELQKSREEAKNKLEGEQGLNKQLENKQKESAGLGSNLATAEESLKKNQDADPQTKQQLEDRIANIKKQKEAVDAAIKTLQADIATAQKQFEEAESDLTTLEERTKNGKPTESAKEEEKKDSPQGDTDENKENVPPTLSSKEALENAYLNVLADKYLESKAGSNGLDLSKATTIINRGDGKYSLQVNLNSVKDKRSPEAKEAVKINLENFDLMSSDNGIVTTSPLSAEELKAKLENLIKKNTYIEL